MARGDRRGEGEGRHARRELAEREPPPKPDPSQKNPQPYERGDPTPPEPSKPEQQEPPKPEQQEQPQPERTPNCPEPAQPDHDELSIERGGDNLDLEDAVARARTALDELQRRQADRAQVELPDVPPVERDIPDNEPEVTDER